MGVALHPALKAGEVYLGSWSLLCHRVHSILLFLDLNHTGDTLYGRVFS